MLSDHSSYPNSSGRLNTFVEMDVLGAYLLSLRAVFSYDGWNRPYDRQSAVVDAPHMIVQRHHGV